ncbi:substrate-binding periplasmic protein [Pseudoalteromonas pernae]|uniref:substrate-binding periplasmic protein n=1 Tax=Pseudoalteromonas pernae TaxID=3118054 RepID=UPI003242E6ED
MCIRIFAGLFLLVQCTFAVAEVTKVTVVIDHAPPYSYTENVEQPSGLILDILQPITQELGVEIKTVSCPFSRCIHMLEQGEADVMGGLIRTPTREQQLTFLTPAYMALHSSFRFYSLRAAELTVRDYEDLYGKRIAVMRGAAHFSRFDKDAKLMKVPVTSEQVAVEMLLKHRVDLFIGVEDTADHAMSVLQQPTEQLAKQPYHFEDSIFGHIAFSDGFAKTELAKKITARYREMANEGELTELVAPYALPPVPTYSL